MPDKPNDPLYTLQVMRNITNWDGVLLDPVILNFLEIGDQVRVIYEQHTPYISITEKLGNGLFKGYVKDPYSHYLCEICNQDGIQSQDDPLCTCHKFHWHDNLELIYYHYKCLKKNPNIKCKTCSEKGYRRNFVKCFDPWINGSIIIFHDYNISEIPAWTKNTHHLTHKFQNKDNMGYLMTGLR